jgi:hypothetical protein
MAWSLMGVFSAQGVGFIVSIFLARLLAPEDYGLVGMSLVFVNLLKVFVDAGFSTALIQRKENSQEIYDAVFSFNLIISISLMLAFRWRLKNLLVTSKRKISKEEVIVTEVTIKCIPNAKLLITE